MRHPLRNGRDSKRRDSECQGLRRLTNRTRFHTFNRTYWVMQGMHAVLRHILRVIFAVAVIAVSGCGASPLYVQTSGTAGPLQWEAVDLASGVEIREGQEVDTYEFTLFLRETRGVGLTFTNVSSTLYGGGWRGGGRHSSNLQLPAFCELRMPLSATGFKSPLWFITLTGKDEKGKPVAITVTVALPPNPSLLPAEQSPFLNAMQPGASVNSDALQSDGSLAQLSMETRRSARMASVGLNPNTVASLLTGNADHISVPVIAATISFEPHIPVTARTGLRNIAGWLISGLLPANATMTLPLDN